MPFNRVGIFLLMFQLVHFAFSLACRSSGDNAGSDICRFLSLERWCRCAVVRAVVSVGEVVNLDLFSSFQRP